jgi:hypothetical protein
MSDALELLKQANDYSIRLQMGEQWCARVDAILAASAGQAEPQKPIATLHDDGHWTWKPGMRMHECNQAGWWMDVCAPTPAAAQEVRTLPALNANECRVPEVMAQDERGAFQTWWEEKAAREYLPKEQAMAHQASWFAWQARASSPDEKDARRYRWLRAQHEMHEEFEDDLGMTCRSPAEHAFTVFKPGRDVSLEPVGCVPGELDQTIDAEIERIDRDAAKSEPRAAERIGGVHPSIATGIDLDAIGDFYKTPRNKGEPGADYRKRIQSIKANFEAWLRDRSQGN